MLRTGIVVLTGMVFAAYSPTLIDSLWVSFLPLVLFICAKQPTFRTIGYLLAGFLWMSLAMHWQLLQRMPAHLNNKRLIIVGEVINIPQNTSGSTKFLFHPLSFSEPVAHLPEKIKLNWRHSPPQLRSGQRWRLLVKIKQAHGYQNPGGFDYERWLFSKGISATGYVIDRSAKNELLRDSRFNLNSWRMAINHQIEKSCRGCRQNGLIQALATGYRGNIDVKTRRLLQQTGTAHLIAVSGLHIGIIAGLFYFLGLGMWRKFSFLHSLARTDAALLLSWLGGLSYSLLSGFELPAQRAMMMLTVLLLTGLLRLPVNLLHSTVVAVLLVLLFSPLAILSSSFWLTLNALLVIIFATLLLHHNQGRLLQLVIVQGLFALLYIPVSLLVFNQWHPASFIANLIAVPWVSLVIVPFNFLLLLLFWLPADFLQALYVLLDNLLTALIWLLSWLSSHGLNAIKMPSPSNWWLTMLVVASLIFLQPGLIISRFVLVFALPLSIFWHPRQPPVLRMTVLDVGQGTAIVLQTAGHNLIYDFGPGNRRGYSLGQWVVRPFLQHAGIDRVDRIILSHSDQDHIGGFYAVQQYFSDIPVFSGMPREIKYKLPQIVYLKDCHHEPAWHWDGVTFQFLQTRHEISERGNNRSCVLKISRGNNHILLAGDIEQLQEKRLLRQDDGQLKANILVVPHHGSMTSSSRAFIKAVGAKQVIISSGYHNRWHFPKEEVMNRYRRSGARIYNTADSGAIEISCDQLTACRINVFRRRHARIWY